jgi:hypothetical protein
MRRTVKLTERDLTRIVTRIIKEQSSFDCSCPNLKEFIQKRVEEIPGDFAKITSASGNWSMLDEDTIVIEYPGMPGMGKTSVQLNIS